MLTILHTEASLGWGGQEMRILAEASAFAKRGFRLLIACQPGSHLGLEAQRRGLSVQPVTMPRAFDLLACWRLRRLMRREAVDLVHTHSSIDAWLAGFAAKSLHLPVVRSRHVSILVKRRRNFVYNALCDRIISSGEAIREVLMTGGVDPDKIVAIPAGVDVAQFHPAVSGTAVRQEFGIGAPVIGTVAMFRHSKGHHVLLQAVPEILRREPRAVFLWVGDGVGRSRLQQQIIAAGLQERVYLTGFRDDVAACLAAMDVVVLPSIKSDGVPQVILQALALRKPVIASAVGGIPEVIQHRKTGTLVPPNDPQALAEAVGQVLCHAQSAAEWARAGGQLIDSHYALEHIVDRTAAVYTAALVEKGLV
ncbi:MAG TPA: glycosyltransferase family 4 protein [Candidatus Tectomicrobia bacterium]|nr:glycosyltransferase family 4 protein [Candidatus Tectomicrobia bacterium]